MAEALPQAPNRPTTPFRIVCAKQPKTQVWDGVVDTPPQSLLWDGRSPITFSGWFVHRFQRVTAISAKASDVVIASTAPSIKRPKVAETHQGWPQSVAPGFQISWQPEVGTWISITADLANGVSIEFAKMLVMRSGDAGIVFVHIAKTAGSSVNAVAKALLGEAAQVHVEGFSEGDIRKIACSRRFISGHVTWSTWRRLLPIRQFRTAIVLREPLAHIISHLAWVRHLAEPEQRARLVQHPPYIQELAQKLLATDLTDARAVGSLFSTFSRPELALFDNVQVRYLRSEQRPQPVTARDATEAIANVTSVDLVGVTEDLDPFVRSLVAWIAPGIAVPETPRENSLPTKFGLDARNPELRKVLSDYIEADRALYRFARESLPGLRRQS